MYVYKGSRETQNEKRITRKEKSPEKGEAKQ